MLRQLIKRAEELEKMIPSTRTIECPCCKSTNFSIVNKPSSKIGWLVGGPLLGLSNKTEAVCHRCGKHFKI